MNKNGPIVVIEDDHDDQYLLELVFKKLGYINKVLYFFNGQEALDYLENTNSIPFLILSDINMPKLDGFALRDKIHMECRTPATVHSLPVFLHGYQSRNGD